MGVHQQFVIPGTRSALLLSYETGVLRWLSMRGHCTDALDFDGITDPSNRITFLVKAISRIRQSQRASRNC